MGKKIGGGILIVWGLFIVFRWLFTGMPLPTEGGYQAGSFFAFLVGCVFLAGGWSLLTRGD
ncbi:MAG: hypothetical protein HUU46_06320 [Candidatus Hydrogenedentes bacterium]|nr:hypothetical protein [Candidatus Hydrogenedentota bacterium]